MAALAVERDLLVVTDEVYEHMTYDGRPHVPLATLPGMRERTLTISSAGKSYSFTGWKVGWVTGVPELVAAVRTAKQFLTYVSGAPFQPAIAAALRMGDAPLDVVADVPGVAAGPAVRGACPSIGFDVFVPAGTYFVTTDIRPARVRRRGGVLPRPAAQGGCRRDPVPGVLRRPGARPAPRRWAFCKRNQVLEMALERLDALRR